MKDWNLKAVWDEIKRTLGSGERDDDSSEDQSSDPTLLFHLMFTAPLLLGLLMMARRA